MLDKRVSESDNCMFVLPASDDVELLINYHGLEWSNENINEDTLFAFSERCLGFSVSFFENENGRIVMFSPKDIPMDSIKIYFERILIEELPCAFFDKVNKIYDNFMVPSSTTEMMVSIGTDSKLIVEWEYDQEETVEEEEESIVAEDENDTISTLEEGNVEIDISDKIRGLKTSCEELSLENDRLRIKAEGLENDVLHLETKIQELEKNAGKEGNDEDKDRKIAELYRLIKKLVDNSFDESYAVTLDAEIKSLTAAALQRKDLLNEKIKSKEKLEQDLQEIENSIAATREEIVKLMENIDKAESILTEDSSELSKKEERMKDMLSALGLDMETLKMHSAVDSLDSILAEASAMKERLEEKLRALGEGC